MSEQRQRDPVLGVTYHGFAAPRFARGDPASVDRPKPRTYVRSELRRHRPSRGAAALTVIVALAVAFCGGAFMGLVLPQDQSPASAPGAAAPPPPPPPETAETVAGTPTPARAIRVKVPRAPPPLRALRTIAKLPPSGAVTQARPTSCAASPAAPGCQPPKIAALDREMNAALAAAIRAGAPGGPLGAAQESWILRRDRAARASRELEADLYVARIAELRSMAGESP
jgi:hypothetical protein